MEFGLEEYDTEQCRQVFELLRPLRIAAGDFTDDRDEGLRGSGREDGYPRGSGARILAHRPILPSEAIRV